MSLDKISSDNSVKWPQYLATFAASGGAFATGTIWGWSTLYQFLGPVVEEENIYIIILVRIFGAILGCIPMGILINKIGRKLTLILLVIPFTVGWILIILIESVILGQFFLGIACGAFCIIIPIYIGEIAQKEVRGNLGTYYLLMNNFGVMFVHCLGQFINELHILNIICGTIPLIFVIVLLFIPETPLFLVSKGRSEAALKSIKWLRGKNYDSEAHLALLELEYEEVKAHTSTCCAALKKPETMKCFAIVLGLMFFQQMSGTQAISFYTPDIFVEKYPDISAQNIQLIPVIIQAISTLVASFLVDKVGRNVLVVMSQTVMAISTCIMAGYWFFRDSGVDISTFGWLPLCAVVTFNTAFAMGLGPVPWIMIGEMFSPQIKGFAVSLVGTFNWFLTIIVFISFDIIRENTPMYDNLFIFSLISFTGIFFMYFIVPETKGKSLTGIQKDLLMKQK